MDNIFVKNDNQYSIDIIILSLLLILISMMVSFDKKKYEVIEEVSTETQILQWESDTSWHYNWK